MTFYATVDEPHGEGSYTPVAWEQEELNFDDNDEYDESSDEEEYTPSEGAHSDWFQE